MARPRRYIVIAFVCASAAACDADLVPLLARHQPDAALADSGVDTLQPDAPWAYPSWGAYARTLDVPACAGDLTLVVNTTQNVLEGGATLSDPAQAGPTLSFLEALTIAANRPERVAIFFDPQVFPADAPATINLDGGCDLPDVQDTCIDARERGVIIDFKGDGSGRSSACTLDLRQDALVVGLELRHLVWQIGASGRSQIAGCRFNTDGFAYTPAGEPETLTPTDGALVGPGNAFGNTEGVRMKYAGMATVVGNYFGIDPVTGAKVFNQFGVEIGSLSALTGTLRIEGNVFATYTGVHFWMGLGAGSRVEIVGNRFEPGIEDELFGWIGITSVLTFGGEVVIGPDNHFSGLDAAIRLDTQAAKVTLTRNTISGCGEAIVLSNAPVQPPSITDATATFAAGSCPVDGQIELFGAAVAGQAERFIGDTSCSAGSWRLDAAIPDAYVTATLTATEGTSALADAAPVTP